MNNDRPGLAKARTRPSVRAAPGLLVRAPDALWRSLFEGADVVSEGGARNEPQGRVWYGSTSVILRPEDLRDDSQTDLIVDTAAQNIHVRLRAVRAALREASLRAPGRLGRLVCDVRVSSAGRALRIDVDVQAPLIERRSSSRTAR